MTNLKKGIQLYYDSANAAGMLKFWLNSGTKPAMEVEPDGNGLYCADGFLPLESWRNPTKTEKKLLCARQPPPDNSRMLVVIRIPDEILEPLERLGLDLVTTQEDYDTFMRDVDFEESIEHVVDYIAGFRVSDRHKLAGPRFIVGRPPGLRSSTYDPDCDCYIGLHVDSWDRRPWDQRDLASNRICVNLGSEDRFLLFINLSMKDIFEISGSFDPREFMRCYPSYPVVKLRIAPNEAYIAPTENFIHDGCTIDKRFIDLTYTLRSYFDIQR